MKIYISHSYSAEYIFKIIKHLSTKIDIVDQISECDLILNMQMGFEYDLINSKKKIITYMWDAYEWIWDYPRGYDWKIYGKILTYSAKILTPSQGQIIRMNQHWNIPYDKCHVVPAYAQFFEFKDIKDCEYICNPTRDIPDRHSGWIELACKELNLPYKHGGKKYGSPILCFEEYMQFIANSSFIVSPWYEGSTGGLPLWEGYNIGKNILICNSDFLGAKEFFKERANYFESNYDSFKKKLQYMWDNKQEMNTNIDLKDRQSFSANFTLEKFCENILYHLQG